MSKLGYGQRFNSAYKERMGTYMQNKTQGCENILKTCISTLKRLIKLNCILMLPSINRLLWPPLKSLRKFLSHFKKQIKYLERILTV